MGFRVFAAVSLPTFLPQEGCAVEHQHKTKTTNTAILVDASNLGTKVKDGKNQKTLLSAADESKIIDTINNNKTVDTFSVVVDTEAIKRKTYSFGAGQYFETTIKYCDLSPDEFRNRIEDTKSILGNLFGDSRKLGSKLLSKLKSLEYDSQQD